jgi:phospholipid/cholesterol/gamma-HCH transport system permease protein
MANERPAPQACDPQVAELSASRSGVWAVSGDWTLSGLGPLIDTLEATRPLGAPQVLDGTRLSALDSTGAWILQRWLRQHPAAPVLEGWPERARALMEAVADSHAPALAPARPRGALEATGRATLASLRQVLDFLGFLGQVAAAGLPLLRRPKAWRIRSVLHELEIGGFDALSIIDLTSFLLGIVVAYQGADQLRNYGANVFVVELVGYAMLREFAPLITAIIIAGRSGSAHAAQLGTMVVNEEIDALRTLGIEPIQRLVLPRLLALSIALPLLTAWADLCGVFGGMVMARTQLDIGFAEFAARFGQVMQGSALLIGIGKSLIFAWIIVLIGCFQGLRTRGSADSVGRQTTLSVVQAIFLVIVVDALFSVAFNVLGL